MQTILGAGGAVGVELAKALPQYTDKIRLVSRNPQKVNDTDELFKADLTNKNEVAEAVRGSDIAYLTVGLPYSTKVWQQTWPVIMDNVIAACYENDCKLVFFDNIYPYDGNLQNPITEEHPINPPSKKGKVRAQILQKVWKAAQDGKIEVLVARAPDFYGPGIKEVSVLTEVVFKPFSNGKSAQWLGSPKYKHSFIYVPDAGKATALLGNTPGAYGESWHLPTADNPPTGKEWIEMIAKEFSVKPKVQVAGKFMLRILGLFIPVMKEMVEMVYQNEQDYVFSSKKIEERLGVKATPYKEGIKQIMELDYSAK